MQHQVRLGPLDPGNLGHRPLYRMSNGVAFRTVETSDLDVDALISHPQPATGTTGRGQAIAEPVEQAHGTSLSCSSRPGRRSSRDLFVGAAPLRRLHGTTLNRHQDVSPLRCGQRHGREPDTADRRHHGFGHQVVGARDALFVVLGGPGPSIGARHCCSCQQAQASSSQLPRGLLVNTRRMLGHKTSIPPARLQRKPELKRPPPGPLPEIAGSGGNGCRPRPCRPPAPEPQANR